MERETTPEATLNAWLGIVWKHKWLVLAFMALVLATAVFFTRRQTKIYQASTQIVIELNAPRYLGRTGTDVVSLGSGNTWNTQEFYETEFRIIKSRMVVGMVVERLGLNRDLDFLGVAQLDDEAARKRRLARADPVSILVGRLSAEALSESRVVSIRVKDHDPVRAAKIADATANAYAEQNVDRKISAAGDAVKWLQDQVITLKDEVITAENALLGYKRSHGILDSSLAAKQNLIGLDLQDARRQLREVGRSATQIQAQLEQVRSLSISEVQTSVEEVLTNGLVQRLKEKLVGLQNERAELLKKYLEKHPDVVVVDRKIDRVRTVLRQEVSGIRKSMTRNWKAAKKSEDKLAQEVLVLEENARVTQGHELAYKRLEAEVNSKKALQVQMEARLKEAQLQAQTRANNVRVLDAALVPSVPISPRTFLNLVLASVLALLGGLGLAFLVDRLDNTVKNQEQLEAYGLTFLGIIPTVRTGRGKEVINPDRCVIDHPNSTAAECVRTIRTNLLFMAPERKLRSMMVTSAGPREGKTCTCVNIGATMALSGSRTLLIDSDLRRPRLHKIFGITNERGLTNLVMDPEVKIADLVNGSGIDGLDLLCSGPLPPNPSEILHTQGFRRTLARVLEQYDRVIFDSPPVGAVTDAQILGQQIDGAVLVVRAGETSREMLKKAVRLLSGVNVRILGALLNNLDVSRRGYGQYYYQYYRHYGTYGSDEADGTVKGEV